MARTTADDVRKIIEIDLDLDSEDSIIDAFIDDANMVVTDLLGGSTVLSSNQLKSIEKWLAAHFIACSRDPQAQEEGTADAKIKYQGKTGMGLDATLYGQQAKMMDTTGILASKLGKKQARMHTIPSWND